MSAVNKRHYLKHQKRKMENKVSCQDMEKKKIGFGNCSGMESKGCHSPPSSGLPNFFLPTDKLGWAIWFKEIHLSSTNFCSRMVKQEF